VTRSIEPASTSVGWVALVLALLGAGRLLIG
jgi:hypothetical protein